MNQSVAQGQQGMVGPVANRNAFELPKEATPYILQPVVTTGEHNTSLAGSSHYSTEGDIQTPTCHSPSL